MNKESSYYVYILRCDDNSLYTGITTDVERRFSEHSEKGEKGAKYTKSHGAKQVEMVWKCENRPLASKLEYHIKRLTKKQKEDLIRTKDLSLFLAGKIDEDLYQVKEK